MVVHEVSGVIWEIGIEVLGEVRLLRLRREVVGGAASLELFEIQRLREG